MTPPDSGDQPLCIVCWLPATRGLPEDGGKLYWCGKHGPFYDKPDSDEREADRICGHVDSAWMCVKVAGHSGTHVCETRNLAIAGVVSIRHSLAQRILAALEGKLTPDGYEESAVLAAELRAIVERKP